MFGSTMLEVAIGLVFVYVLISIFCSAINEFVFARILRWRSVMLQESIQNLLGGARGAKIAEDLYKHPLIKGLITERRGENKVPRWITAATFVPALLDIVGFGEKYALKKGQPGGLKAAVDDLDDSVVKKLLSSMLVSVGDDIKLFQKKLEKWFDDAMEQVTAWYKRRSELVIFIWAAVVCVGLNIDTFEIGDALARNSALRADVIAAAERWAGEQLPADTTVAEDVTPPEDTTVSLTADTSSVSAVPDSTIAAEDAPSIEELRKFYDNIRSLNLPIGWWDREGAMDADGFDWGALPSKIGGLLITIFAVSLGAPFWFDVLNKLLALRRGRRPESDDTEEKKPKD